MERIATDTYDFEIVRTMGYTYVDKTDLVHLLAAGSIGRQFFLSRPRRFGKSLLVSTLQKLFEGRRDLFTGLAIDGLPWDWELRYPVLRLDFSTCSGTTLDEVVEGIESVLRRESERLGVPLRPEGGVRERLLSLVEDTAALGPTGQCVLLVDEYDKPLSRYIGTPEVGPYRDFLKSLYSVVKASESKQRFCLMTGVSKFSKVSIFSDLNNLTDITMDTRFASLLGYTHDEVRTFFPERLKALAAALGCDEGATFDKLVAMYDGYCFDKSMTHVFNPVSLGRCLDCADLRSFWFETGTPGWLMSYAKQIPLNVDSLEVDEATLGTFEPESPFMPAVLFQTGYLTIVGFEEIGRARTYKLGFPNHEVEDGFNAWLVDAYTTADGPTASAWAIACHRALQEGDGKAFVQALSSFFSSIGYDLDDRLTEQAYQCVAVAILRFIGVYLNAEVTTSQGRIDMVCESPSSVFVIELKVTGSQNAGKRAAREALDQIRARGYADGYACDRRRVHLLGISFDCSTHNVAAWEQETL